MTIPCKTDRVGEILDTMRAMQKGAIITDETIGGVRATVEDLFARFKAATYSVVVWNPACFDFAGGDLTVQAICEFIKEADLTTRSAGLSLGGNEGAPSAVSVCAWR